MKKIKGCKKLDNYYKVYDRLKNLKRIIATNQEKQLDEEEWLEGVSCFVINEKGEVLIEKRVSKGLTPGKLDLCSGHIDNEETHTQAMIRELKEELGIEAEEAMNVIKLDKNAAPLEFVSANKKRNFFITFYCLKRVTSEVKIQEEEIEKIVWLPLEETFVLINSGRTKFPTSYDYEPIFQKVRDICKDRNINEAQER
ncbi:MAG: NUDIX hydrolase [Clostridia bacterium]|nr:NUDIX hydrolase [Clostridia bacterium]